MKVAKGVRLPNPGDILKVRVTLSMKDHARWPAIQQEVRDWGEKQDFIVHAVQPVRPKSELEAERTAATRARTHQSDEQVMTTYGKLRSVDAATLKTGLSLLRKV